jgi:aryl-alcohol dehydrogenase-like predicted oxidoreductase
MSRFEKLGLGTVQWGLPYGISNHGGVTPPRTVSMILAEARRFGVSLLDTGSLYGEAESVLGANALDEFRVVTKTPRFATSTITQAQASQLEEVFRRSLERLSCARIYGLLAHHANDLLVPGGKRLLHAMSDLRQQGRVEKIGVSVYDGEQLDAVLNVFTPDIVQLPLSVLDQRMLVDGHLERLSEKGVEVHARSAFLQGLLLMPLDRVSDYFGPIRPLLSRWHSAARDQGFTLAQAALSFVRDSQNVSTVLVGVEDLAQFKACLKDFQVDATFDATGLGCEEPMFVNPTLWKN